MPEQSSKSALKVTGSDFQAPFETAITRFGVKGLNITDAIDFVEQNELTRMVNVTHRVDGGVTTRPGLTLLNTAGANHHTIKRLADPENDTFTGIHGVDTSVYTGVTGALVAADSGYSGLPLAMVPYHPPLNGVPWMYIADSDKMRKVRGDGLVLPIGLPVPTAVATVALGTENKTNIANFNDDGTAYTAWTANAGKTIPTNLILPDDTSLPAPVDTQEPLIASVTGPGGTTGLEVVIRAPLGTPVTGSGQPFYNSVGVLVNRDMSKVGSIDAEDDDYIHFFLRFANTAAINEVRIYFVCSEVCDPTKVPGLGTTAIAGGAIPNSDFFYGTFQPQGISTALNAEQTVDVAEVASSRRRAVDDVNSTPAVPRNPGLAPGTTYLLTGPGSLTWQEFSGYADTIPVRRGDFARVGTTTGRGWDTITGIVFYFVAGAKVDITGVHIADMYLTGGEGPDSGDPTSTPYDYVYTNYDTRTGAESNPMSEEKDLGVEITTSAEIDSLRRTITVTPTAYGNVSIHQRFYRRGGTLPTDWFFVGENGADGAAFDDNVTDNEAAAAGGVETNNNQPVATVDSDGGTVLAQPAFSLWGPCEDLLMACGDPHRPGHVYFCKPGNAESWPPENHTEVCSPSEQLLAGIMYGGAAYVFSGTRMYNLVPNLSGDITGVTVVNTQCKQGLASRWGVTVGIGGIVFVSNNGIYRTTGGPPEWLTKKIDPLFRSQSKNGILPIDFDVPEMIRLEIHENELWFLYQDTDGDAVCLIYNLILQFWRQYTSTKGVSCFYSDENSSPSVLVVGSKTLGREWTHEGLSDDGDVIACQIRTAAVFFDKPREEKRLGDQILDIDAQGADVVIQNFYNYETAFDDPGTISAGDERDRVIIDAFGITPRRAINISTDLSWGTASNQPTLYYLGTSSIIEPDITTNRVTQWDDLNLGDEVYLTGVTFDCDTGGEDRTVLIEIDFNGVTSTAYTATVNCDGRHKIKFSWPAVQAHKVRVRPADETCAFWILYKVDWIFLPEPPRISKWDVHFENAWDSYYTGLDLYCDTFGEDKTVQVYVDELLIKTETVNTAGRLVHHITLPWGRGHVFRFVSTDDNVGLLYGHRWFTEAEPSEQTNWNQNFTIEGTEAEKYLKAIVFQCDTFGADKTVTVETDGEVVETLTINTDGRKVVQKAFPQHLGSVFRIYPTDDNPSRLYSVLWVFDNEPLFLDRWETQEVDFGIPGWSYPIYAHITLRSTTEVNLQIIAYNQSGAATEKNYAIDSTNGIKVKTFVPFQAVKGVLFKMVLTSEDPFALYREETNMMVRAWGGGKTIEAHPFGNDDNVSRSMMRASLAAARGNYGSEQA